MLIQPSFETLIDLQSHNGDSDTFQIALDTKDTWDHFGPSTKYYSFSQQQNHDLGYEMFSLLISDADKYEYPYLLKSEQSA